MNIETGIGCAFDAQVRAMRRTTFRTYVGSPVRECLPIKKGARLTQFVLGDFVSVTGDRTVSPLSAELALGGILHMIHQGAGETLLAVIHVKAILYCACDLVTDIGEAVFLDLTDSRRRLTMQPADKSKAIQIGLLSALQPDNDRCHIAMAGVGAKPFTVARPFRETAR